MKSGAHCNFITIFQDICRIRSLQPLKIQAHNRSLTFRKAAIYLYPRNFPKPFIQKLHHPFFFFLYPVHAGFQHEFHTGKKCPDPRQILSADLILIITVFISKLLTVPPCAAILQWLQFQPLSYEKAPGALYSQKTFMPCKNNPICPPAVCIHRNTACTLRYINKQKQIIFSYKISNQLHILHISGHIGTVVYNKS